MSGCVYAAGAVSGLDGDDFVIFLSEISKPAILELKPAVLTAINEPFEINPRIRDIEREPI